LETLFENLISTIHTWLLSSKMIIVVCLLIWLWLLLAFATALKILNYKHGVRVKS